jgi:hypothetical protein
MRFLAFLVALLISAPALAAPVPSNGIINTPGTYELAADRTSTGMFNIKITVSNVTLDLNGKTVRCSPSDPGTAVTFGVYATSLNNVTIRNGKITGCFFGVHAGYSNYTTIDGVDFTGNTYIGANMGGVGGVVRDSIFADIAGYDDEAYAIGINNPGSNCIVERNVFRDLYRQPGAAPGVPGEGVGILGSANATGCTFRNNWLENSPGYDIGIWIGSGGSATILENTIVGFGRGVVGGGSADVFQNVFWLTEPVPDAVPISLTGGTQDGNLISGY